MSAKGRWVAAWAGRAIILGLARLALCPPITFPGLVMVMDHKKVLREYVECWMACGDMSLLVCDGWLEVCGRWITGRTGGDICIPEAPAYFTSDVIDG